jgi:glycine/D-amino acid oxidase-like deaminating enzyme
MTEHLAVDVAIIGGGTAACAAAVALREAGLTVAVLEKRLCGAGASGVNFGGVRQQGRHLAELPLARRARALWGDLNQLLGEMSSSKRPDISNWRAPKLTWRNWNVTRRVRLSMVSH